MNDFQLVNPENPDKCDPSKSQWYLDPALAARIVEWSLRPYNASMAASSFRALEPSAGRGALANALRERVRTVQCCDIDAQNVDYLIAIGFGSWRRDFLELDPGEPGPFDIVCMNPPFENGQTEAHVTHALKFAPRVVCHCPLTTLAGKERREGLWSSAYLKRLVIHSSRPKYSGSLKGGMTDMCTIDVVRRPEGKQAMNGLVAMSGVDVEFWA